MADQQLRKELQRFAAEELRSELNAFFIRLEDRLTHTAGIQGLKKQLTRQMTAGEDLHLADGNHDDEDTNEVGGGWMGRFRANLKTPLGDGIPEPQSKEPSRNEASSYTPMLGDSSPQDPPSAAEQLREAQNRQSEKVRGQEQAFLRRSQRKASQLNKRMSVFARAKGIAEIEDGEAAAEPTCRNRVQLLVDSLYFEYVVCAVIFANALVMGLEANWQVLRCTVELPTHYKVTDAVFCAFFASELGLRIWALGLHFFGCSEHDWLWNYFDLTVVVMQIFETLFSLAGSHLSPGVGIFKILRAVRLCRCARVFRLVRAFRLVPELHMLVVTCSGSMRSLFWTIFILFFTTYVFGMYITQVVAEHGETHPDDVKGDGDLGFYFGSIQSTVFKLYQTMFNGDDWYKLTDPLIQDISPWLGFIYCLYIAFTVICLLNVITGVFLNSAMQTAEDDKNRRMLNQIRDMFIAGDADGSGQLNIHEFEAHLDNPDMQLYLRTIGLIPDEAAELFYLLDRDNSGQISASEFVHGCMRLRGNAKAVDFAVFEQSFEALASRLKWHMNFVEAQLGQDALLPRESTRSRK